MVSRSFVSKFQGTFSNFFRLLIPMNKCLYLTSVIPMAFCSNENLKKIEITSPDKLSHPFLLKQASSQTANSVSQLLNQTISALIDTAEEYKKALNDLMTLIEESQTHLGNEIIQQEVSDLMMEQRSKVNGHKSEFMELDSLLEYVERVVISTSETTFLVGAEYASISLSEHLHIAKQEILRIKRDVENLEQQYLKMQKVFIESSTKSDKDNH